MVKIIFLKKMARLSNLLITYKLYSIMGTDEEVIHFVEFSVINLLNLARTFDTKI